MTTANIGNGWQVLGQWKGAVYVRVPYDLRVPIDGGCCCDWCKSHPSEVPSWDVMAVPLGQSGTEHTWTEHSWTVHMPDTRELGIAR